MLRPSDEYFKFPIRVYDPNYDIEGGEEYLRLHGHRPKRLYVIGYTKVKVQDIVSWEDTFSKYTPIEKVQDKGSMLTLVITRDNEYFCSWTRERFEEALNKFVEGIEDSIEQEIMQERQEQMEEEKKQAGVRELSPENITPEIAQALEKILKEYKKQQNQNKDGQQTTEGTV